MARDGFACRDCGDSINTLQVHHCFYEKGDPWETSDGYLLTLCEPCHIHRQEIEGRYKEMLGEMMAATPTDALYALFDFHGSCAGSVLRTQTLLAAYQFKNPTMNDRIDAWFARQREAVERLST